MVYITHAMAIINTGNIIQVKVRIIWVNAKIFTGEGNHNEHQDKHNMSKSKYR